jgi:putative nucleotidyltransferase with HDIG domain
MENETLALIRRECILSIFRLVEQRDILTAEHQLRTANLAKLIAAELGLPNEAALGVYWGALIHDIGKVRIPMEILLAERKLTPNEYELVKTHPDIGHDIVKPIPLHWPIADIILQHHERLDGSGYPNGLTDEKIILESRIVAVSDVFESMTGNRPYRTNRSPKKAMQFLSESSGILFDTNVVEACLKLVNNKQVI